MTGMTIGRVARAARCRTETIHYYERTGLMPSPARTPGGHRIYADTEVRRLKFIRRCRELGFGIAQIRTLLGFVDEPDHSCGEVRAVASAQAREVEVKIADLQRLKTALDLMVSQCQGERYPVAECPIVDALFNRDDLVDSAS